VSAGGMWGGGAGGGAGGGLRGGLRGGEIYVRRNAVRCCCCCCSLTRSLRLFLPFLFFSFLFFSFHFFFFLPFHPRLSKHALCPVMPKRTFDPLIYQPHFFAGPTDLQCRSRGFRFFEFLGLFAAASSISTRL
jgi:hypothetical protein